MTTLKGIGNSLYSSNTCNASKFVLSLNCLDTNFNLSLIASPCSVFNSELTFFYVSHTHSKSHELNSEASSSVNLSYETELDLGGMIGDETIITLVLSLVVFSLVNGSFSGLPILPIFLFIWVFYILCLTYQILHIQWFYF